ncbi:matrilin-2 [Nematostella vectensis]|uniref:matrilin-2 n=1 Tax=Nematostella vectensis TaxID=45351 RepID=UPI0020777721|nr:matrilin-2 [Nematostella vectensis]
MISKLILIALGLVLAFVLPFAHGGPNDIEVQLDDGTKQILKKIGCYKDKPFPNRALRDLYHNHRWDIDWSQWPDMTHVISACASWAKRKNYNDKFGVQFYGECWADADSSRFNDHGLATNCINGVGEHWSNFVYSMKGVCPPLKMNLVFLIDNSGSINDTEFDNFKEFAKKLAESFTISATYTHVAAVYFNTLANFGFNLKYDINVIKTAIDNLPNIGGGTHIGKALTYTLDNVFKVAPRQNVKNVLVVLTDGKSHDSVTLPAAAVRNYGPGVEVFAVGVGAGDSFVAQLNVIASDPDEDHVFHVEHFSQIESTTGAVEDEICKDYI